MRRYYGYYDMGPVRIPPLPQGIVFTDRTTGTLYLLSHDSGEGTTSLETPVPSQWTGRAYGPTDGPFLSSPDGLLRLYVDNGVLSKELAPTVHQGREGGRILTRNFSEANVVFEVTAPDGVDGAFTVTQVYPE